MAQSTNVAVLCFDHAEFYAWYCTLDKAPRTHYRIICHINHARGIDFDAITVLDKFWKRNDARELYDHVLSQQRLAKRFAGQSGEDGSTRPNGIRDEPIRFLEKPIAWILERIANLARGESRKRD